MAEMESRSADGGGTLLGVRGHRLPPRLRLGKALLSRESEACATHTLEVEECIILSTPQ